MDQASVLPRSNLVTIIGYDEHNKIVATRSAFFLSANLIVLSLFSDDHNVTRTRALNWQDQEISFEALVSDEAADLHLARVERDDGPGGYLPAVRTPKIGDILRMLAPDGVTEFKFKGVRELPGWGSVFQIISSADQQDGAPILNEGGQLVGVVMCRWVDGRREKFGLPLSCVFSLLQRGLASAVQTQAKLNRLLDEWEADGIDSVAKLDSMTRERDQLEERVANQEKLLNEKAASEGTFQERVQELQAENRRIKQYRMVGATALILVAIFLLTVWPTIYRYERLVGSPVKINRFTGRAEMLEGSGWQPAVAKLESAPSVPQSGNLATEELGQLKGRADWCSDNGSTLCIDFHNGTRRALDEITFMITAKTGAGKIIWERGFVGPANIGPQANQMLRIEVGERPQSYSWSIVSATGTVP